MEEPTVLIVVCLGTFFHIQSIGSINVSLSAIQKDFGTGLAAFWGSFPQLLAFRCLMAFGLAMATLPLCTTLLALLVRLAGRSKGR